MANKKISELTSATPTTSSVLPASDSTGTVTNKITVQSILDLDARWNVFKPGQATVTSVTAGNAQATVSFQTAGSLLPQTPLTDYSIQYSADNGSTWTNFTHSATTNTTVTVTGLSNGRTYVFRVAGINGVGTGPYSSASSSVTPATVPGSPASLSASPGNTVANLSWSAPADNGGSAVLDYVIEYSTDSGATWTAYSDGTNTNTSLTVIGLTNGTAYLFRVSAVNALGQSAASSLTTAITPSNATAPGTPTSVSATAGNQQLALSWTAPTSDGNSAITGYTVRYTPSGGTASTVNTGSTSTSYTLTGLTNGTAYTVAVAAVNAIGTSTYSSTASGTPVTVPGAPTGVAGTSGDAQVALAWTAPSSTGGSAITDYTVQYSSNSGSTWTTFSRAASTTASATVTGLTNGTAYVFQVRAVNAVGNGNYSSASAAVTPAAAAALTLTQSAGVTWSGSGSLASPYSYTGQIAQTAISSGATRLTFTAVGAGVFYFQTNYQDPADDNTSELRIYKNGAQVFYAVLNGNSAQNVAFDASAGSVFTFAINNGSGTVYFQNTQVWLGAYYVPVAPSGFSVNPGSNHLYMRWTAPVDPVGKPITGYAVEYTPSGGSATLVTLASTARSYVADNLTNGTAYSVRVRAINAVGDGAFTSSVSGTPFSGASLALTRTGGGTWTGTGVSGSAYTCSANLDQSGVSSGATRLTFTALQKGVFYFQTDYKDTADDNGSNVRIYKNGVQVFTAGYNGNATISQNYALTYGDVITFNINDGNTSFGPYLFNNTQAYLAAYSIIGDPTGFSATGGDGQASLSWTAPSSNASLITDYVIQYSWDDGTIWRTWAHTASAATSATITGLWNGVGYKFRIKAIGTTGGDSQFVTSTAVTPTGAANASIIGSYVITNYSSGAWSGTGPVTSSSTFGPVNNSTLPFVIAATASTDVTLAYRHQNATEDDNHGKQTVYYRINGSNLELTQSNPGASADTSVKLRLNAGDILALYVTGSSGYNAPTDTYTNISITAAAATSPKMFAISLANFGTWSGTGTAADKFASTAFTRGVNGGSGPIFYAIGDCTVYMSATLGTIADDNIQRLALSRVNNTGAVYIVEGNTATVSATFLRGQYIWLASDGMSVSNLQVWAT